MLRTTLTFLTATALTLGITADGMARKKAQPDLNPYFTASTTTAATPDSEGFIRRWLILEPIEKPNRSNTVFTDSYLREVFNNKAFSGATLPRDGEKVKFDKETLRWHSLDSEKFNVKLFRFATLLEKPHYGVIFLVATAIDCEEDIPDVRLSVGSNSASMWWIDGEEALLLSGDRRMVQDDCMSRHLTLHKGRNIIRGAIINGPGMSDFCVRFLNEKGEPVDNFTVSTK